MTALGMTALNLRIAEFKFTHNFAICDRLPDMEIISGIDIQTSFHFHALGTKRSKPVIIIFLWISLQYQKQHRYSKSFHFHTLETKRRIVIYKGMVNS